MALVVADRVQETTSTTGTSDYVLIGAADGYQSFGAVMANADTTYYAITNDTDWEVGIGTYSTTGPTLARTTILASSNGGSAVSWGVGVKNIFISYAASKSVYLDANGDLLVSDKIVHAGDTNTAIRFPAADTVSVETGGTERFKVENSTITTTVPIVLPADPTLPLQAATKEYVDTLVASGIHFHQPVRVESPINLNATYNNGTSGVGATLTNAGTQAALVIDGVTVATNDRVLVYQQTTQTQNGVYVVTSTGSGSTNWVLTRSADTDSYVINDANGLSEGSTVFVQQGTTGAGETYTCNTSGVITFGTTNITFAQISNAQIYSAGAGLALTGTVFSNTAPDQTVTLTQGGATTISGTYPNFTITSTDTTYSAGNGIGLAGTTFSVAAGSGLTQDASGLSHADTSSQSSVDNSGATFVQDVNLDTFGHVTGLTSVTVTPSLIGAPSTTGVGASGSWGISVTGTATNVTGTVAIANGGTGATTAGQALNNLGLTATATELNYTSGVTSAIQTQLDAKAPLASPALTGTPTAPTASVGTNTTQVATTAFVNAEIANDAPTKTGGGASGSWGISVTGTSANVTGTVAVANGGTGATDAATARTNLGLAIGTNVQAYDAGLQSISGLTTSANQMIYTTASDTYATTSLTAAGRAILDDADAAAQRTTLGLGTIATQAANSVTITGGSISGITDLAIADGGTGASDAGTARTNLNVPTRTGGDASGTWGIAISGNAATSTLSVIQDTRAGALTPNDYADYRVSYEFTDQVIGGDWHSAITPKGWSDTYAAWQLWGPSSTTAHENWYLRSGVNTTWNPLRTILHSGNYNSFAPTLTGTGASGTWGINVTGSSGSTTGNAATATNLSTNRTNWSTNGTISAVVGQLAWKNYGNNHTIFDASNSTSPSGTGVNDTNADIGWSASYPTLMGWNGVNTYGVRVDSARVSDSAGSVAWGNVSSKPSNIMYYQGFTLDANTMDSNSTGFTYSVNAPATGPVARFSAGGSYDLWLNAPYSGGGNNLYFRTRNGDTNTLNSWRTVLNDANYNSYAPTLTGSGASGTWGISISGNATTATTATTANALATGNNYRVNSLGVGTAASGTAGEIRATNNITAYFSDDRLKTRFSNIDDALGKVMSLSGFYYEANETAQALGYEVKQEVGVSAQEVQAVMPEVVAPAPIDEQYLTVRYERLVPLLIEAIKAQQAQIDELKSRLKD